MEVKQPEALGLATAGHKEMCHACVEFLYELPKPATMFTLTSQQPPKK